MKKLLKVLPLLLLFFALGAQGTCAHVPQETPSAASGSYLSPPEQETQRPSSAVPEPSGSLLFLVGGIAMYLSIRGSRRKRV